MSPALSSLHAGLHVRLHAASAAAPSGLETHLCSFRSAALQLFASPGITTADAVKTRWPRRVLPIVCPLAPDVAANKATATITIAILIWPSFVAPFELERQSRAAWPMLGLFHNAYLPNSAGGSGDVIDQGASRPRVACNDVSSGGRH
jgi:hypothetical protein